MCQHNHHCLITVDRHDWHIARVRGNIIYLSRWLIDGRLIHEVLDISHVDMEAYCISAVEWDRRRQNVG